jgi:hypothetical protein
MIARILILILLVVLLFGVGYVLVKQQRALDAARLPARSAQTYTSLAVAAGEGEKVSVGVVRSFSRDSLQLSEVVDGQEALSAYALAPETQIAGEIRPGGAVVVVSREADGQRKAVRVYAQFDHGARIVDPMPVFEKPAQPAAARPQGPGGPEPGGPRSRPQPE